MLCISAFLVALSSLLRACTCQVTASPMMGPFLALGDTGYTRYYHGNGPIIFVINHGGYDEPQGWDVRENGCYNEFVNPQCDWTSHSCGGGDPECQALLERDEFTEEIGLCLLSMTSFSVPNAPFQVLEPHLIINDLHRRYLDSNRQLEQAAQDLNNDIPEAAFWELHDDSSTSFIYSAKKQAINRCGFGILFDIHGQNTNDFIHFGYRMSEGNIEGDDAFVNGDPNNPKRSSVGGLTRAPYSWDMADIIRGDNSLGSRLSLKDDDYLVIPSSNYPKVGGGTIVDDLEDFHYFTGDFTIKRHGSSEWNTVGQTNNNQGYMYTPPNKSNLEVEAVHVEIPRNIRYNEDGFNRDLFCVHLSEAIEEFVTYFYDVNDCKY